uniref:Uncharacterized protein n=1 Tax=Castor canadensis TaxID=51338 RepID=A0A8C0WVW8_CASCN
MHCLERNGKGDGGDMDSWNPMAAQCAKCERPDPRSSPYTLVRITEAEMRAYHHFLGSCVRLEYRAKQELGLVLPMLDIRRVTEILRMSFPVMVAKGILCRVC